MATLHHPVNASRFSSGDLQRITDYMAILISIDRKNAKGESPEKSYAQTYQHVRKWLANVFQRTNEGLTALEYAARK